MAGHVLSVCRYTPAFLSADYSTKKVPNNSQKFTGRVKVTVRATHDRVYFPPRNKTRDYVRTELSNNETHQSDVKSVS